MSDATIQYIRDRAKALRAKAHELNTKNGSESDAADYNSGARHLDIVADEIASEFHIDEEDE